MRKYFLLLMLLSLLCSVYAAIGCQISNTFDISVCTLPVELSSFTAIATGQNNVQISWATQSETNLIGFYIYRDSVGDQANAICVSPLFPATNTSTLQSYVYTDHQVGTGLWYYWLESREFDGSSQFHGPVSITLSGDGQQSSPGIPLVTGIKSVYPNPFNPSTTIIVELSKKSNVQVVIYNLKGELIRQLDSGTKNAGTYNMLWNGLNDDGQACGSGIYLLKLTADGESTQAKLTLMK